MDPEIELPWDGIEMSHVWQDGKPVHSSSEDSEYATHAANAYPKLVKLAKEFADVETSFAARNLLKELGEME